MEFTGTRIVHADVDTVWRHLNSPQTLRVAIPGCQEFTGSTEEGFNAVVSFKLGYFSATFKGAVRLENVDAPHSYTLIGEGKGGLAGYAKAISHVTLTPVPEGTELGYRSEAALGGRLAKLSNSVLGPIATRIADTFFARLQVEMEKPN